MGLSSTRDACALVDELGSSAIGEIVVLGSEGPRGTVFVEQGRVCWAAARGLARRLSELLSARASLSPSAMESMFKDCQSQRVPLGEHLVSRGVLSATDLRDALLQHTVESLRRLCRADARTQWCPRAGAGYSPRFTFATAELLAHAGASAHEASAASVRPMLEQLEHLFDEGDWAAAFVRAASLPFPEPIAVRGAVPASATTLLRLGKWAAGVVDATAAFADDSAFFAATRPTRDGPRAVVAFRHGAVVVTGETGAHGPARILNHRAKQRRTKGSANADL